MRLQRNIVVGILFLIALALFLYPTAIYAQLELDGKSVCVDPGHGGSDPGCPGYNGDAYPDEADITLQICHDFLEGYITYAGGNVYVTRIMDVYVSPSDRARIANGEKDDAYGNRAPDGGVDYFVSVHCNASGNPNAHGTQIMISGPVDWATDVNTTTDRFRMALNTVNAYVSTKEDIYWDAGIWENGPGWVDQPDEGYTPPTDGIYGRTELTVLNNTIMPANIVETEFATNPTAWGHLTDSLWIGGYQDYAAHGITNGLIGFTGGTWRPAVRLTYDLSWHPSIAVSGAKVHVAWSSMNEIYYNRSDDGGCSWGTDRRLTYFEDGLAKRPELASSLSNVHLVSEHYNDGYYEIFFKRSLDDGNSWGNNIILTSSSSRAFNFDIATDVDDRIHIVWADAKSGQWEIYYIRSIDGGTTWGPETRLTYTGSNWGPKIAIDPFGNIHIVWLASFSSRGKDQQGEKLYHPRVNIHRRCRNSLGKAMITNFSEIHYIRSTNGGDSWGPEVRIVGTWSPEAGSPSIATDDSSGVHVVWEDLNEDNPSYCDVYYVRSTNGGDTWGPDTMLTYGAGSDVMLTVAEVATDGSGWVHVVWRDERNGNPELYYKRSMDGGKTWGQERRLTNTPEWALCPTMATDDYNRIHLAWAEEENIYYKRPGFGCDGWGVFVDQGQGEMAVPSQYSLSQNYPNPFNPDTKIEYSLPKDSQVKLIVYNTLGQRVKTLVNEEQKSGFYTIRWDGKNEGGRDLSSGIYFYRLVAGNFSQTKKMVMLK